MKQSNRRKKRWTSSFGGKRERFSYAADRSGKFLFFRNHNPFSWEPLAVDRSAAKALVDELNALRGKDINAAGFRITEAFVAKARLAALKAARDAKLQAAISGPAESGEAKEKTT